MQPEQANDTMMEICRLRRRTRSDLQAFWFPLIVFGALSIGGAAVILASWGLAVALYWAVAGPAGGIATGHYYHQRGRNLGVETPPARYIAVAIAIMVGCFLTGALGGARGSDLTAAVGPSLCISVGYVAFAYLERSVSVAVIAIALGALACALVIGDMMPNRIAAILALVYGVTFLLTGLLFRAAAKGRE
jgi:hypothetical protein